MFDPTHVGNVKFDAVKFWKLVDKQTKSVTPVLFAILNLQGIDHGIVLKENKDGIADQLVIDRLKHMCGLEPMHTAMLRIPFGVALNVETGQYEAFEKQNTEYFMFRAKFRKLANGKVKFIKEPNLSDYDQELVQYREFRIELFKILVFHWLIGFESSIENIIVRDGLPMAIGDYRLFNGSPKPEFVQLVLGNLIKNDKHEDIEILLEAVNEVKGHFDFDNMRGCLLLSRKEETDLNHRHPRMRLSGPVRDFAINIEQRLDFISECTDGDVKNPFRSNTIKEFIEQLLTGFKG